MLEKTFFVTKDDLKQFYKHFLKRSFPLSMVLTLVLVLVLLTGMALFGEAQLSLLILPVFIILVTVFLLFLPDLFASRVLKQNVHYQHEITFTLSEEGTTQKAYGGFTSLKWGDLYEVRETKTLFLFFIMQNQACLFPKRLFTAKELEQASKLIHEKGIYRKKHWFKQAEGVFFTILLIVMLLAVAALAISRFF